MRGDGERALALHRSGYREARASGGPRTIALALEGMAGALALLDEHAQAARLLGTADATRRGTGAPLPAAERGDVERITARTRAALGDAAFAAVRRGRRHEPSRVRTVERLTGTRHKRVCGAAERWRQT